MREHEHTEVRLAEVQDLLDAGGGVVVDPPGQPMPNARRFLSLEYGHPEHPLLVHQGGQFYRWSGTCWLNVDDSGLRARLYEHFEDAEYEHVLKDGIEMRPFAPTVRKVADLIDALRAITHLPVATTTPTWLSENTLAADELISCTNGLVHWPMRTLHPHTPLFYAHHAVEFPFCVDAGAPVRWLKFLREQWADDDDSLDTLQEIFGYIVSGDTRLQKMFLIVGPKRSGKGTIARVLKAMLGAHNIAGPTLASIATNFGLQPLIGKPAAIIADARLMGSHISVVTERLLSVSGEDTLTVDRKYREPWTGQLPSRIVILSNELPRLSDSSGALASRFVVLTMTRSFYGRENPNLTAELVTELPGIFNWALEGLERLRQRGYFVQPAASEEAIRELEDLGSPVGAFVREECEVGPAHEIAVDALYAAWQTWCEEHGHRARSSQIFGRDLRAVLPAIQMKRPQTPNGERRRAYRGIGLVRSGPRTAAMCSARASDPQGPHEEKCSEVDRGPSRTRERIAVL